MNGEEGSIESTPTVRPASRWAFVSAPIKRRLADARRPGEADDRRFAGVRIDLLDQLPALWAVVLDQRDRARQRTAVAVEQALGEGRDRSSRAQSSQGAYDSTAMEPMIAEPTDRRRPPTEIAETRAPRPAAAARRPARAAAVHARQPHAQPRLRCTCSRASLYLKLRHGGRLQTDGICFICPGVQLEIGRHATLRIGRWAWLGHGTKIRVHEGEVAIGAKTVMGQECTISAFQHVSIGRECIIADRVMLIDFDHGVVEVERPIRLQGIYKRDVRVGPQRLDGLRRVHPARGRRSATTRSSAPARWSQRTCPKTPSSPARPRG